MRVGNLAKLGAAVLLVGALSGTANAQKWRMLTNQPVNGSGGVASVETCMLLTDGTVMCLETSTNIWHRLRPDVNGSYLNGTWDKLIPPMPNAVDSHLEVFNTTTMVGTPCVAATPCMYAPRFFASAVMQNGRVIVIGGEYNIGTTVVGSLGKNGFAETNIGFIYDPVTNAWGPQLDETNSGLGFGLGQIGDAQCSILPNGTFLLAGIFTRDLEQFNPLAGLAGNFTRRNSTGKFSNNSEEGWTLLPDGTMLTVSVGASGLFELYNPTTNVWTQPGTASPGTIPNMPVNLADFGPGTGGSSELGPSVVRPDGTVVWFSGGALGQNAIYNIAAGTWANTAAIDFPVFDPVTGTRFAVGDGPAALLPNGNVLVLANPISSTACANPAPPPPPMCGPFNVPGVFFEMAFSDTTLTMLDEQPAGAASTVSYVGRLLLLPTGEVLYTQMDSAPGAQLYVNGGLPQDAWRPVIGTAPTTVAPGNSYPISGTMFTGFSEGSTYGDDAAMSTNYPLVRIKNNATGHVFYTRTHDHSRMGIVSVGSAEVTSTTFDVPAGIELGASTIVVVTNGIPSAERAITVAVNHPPVAVCKNVTVSANATCQGTASATDVNNGSSDPDGDSINCVLAPTGTFPLGNTNVTLTCTDPSGAQGSCTAVVTVADNTPPALVCPVSVNVMCTNANGAVATFATSATDNCGSVGTITCTPASGSTFPLGTRLDTCTVNDGRGNSASCSFNVTVALGDNPVCCPAGTNVILGTSNNNTLNGTAGNDCILGRGGQDTINGNGGNDFISGGDGDDVITGGAGNDLIFGGTGQDNISGNTGNDVISGGDGDDQVFGGDGSDTLLGGQGQDRLFGENDNDTLVGETGDDRLEGGAGDDLMTGGGLHDTCIGGPGTDTFLTCQNQTQ